MKNGKAIVFLIMILAIGGCLERTTYSTTDSSDKVGRYLLDRPPKNIAHPLDARFEDKIILLGYDLDKTEVRRGESFKIIWYWQCIDAPGPGWRVFTHITNAKGRTKLNRDKAGPIRNNFQPEHWRAGLVIRDVQEIEVPGKWTSEIFELRVGLWRGSRRMSGLGKSVDSSNSVKGPQIIVTPAGPLRVKVPYTAKAPIIDGEFDDEEVWQRAAKLGSFKHTMSGKRAQRATDVRVMWDDENLYVAMRAEDDYLVSQYREHDDALWHEDAFEIFLDPKGDAKRYYELQVSPTGVVFDAFLPAYRENQNAWTSHVVVKVQLLGELDKEHADDKAWMAELAIPFSALHVEDGVPPKSGDTWKANFFRIDKMEKKKQYSAWSPPLRGDFHALDKFGQMTFAKPSAKRVNARAAFSAAAQQSDRAKPSREKGKQPSENK